METSNDRLADELRRFQLTKFRRGQQEVIQTVLDGQDCLCVMPTGGGKSLCYQLPAVVRDGMTLVVSPLIALMKDQVDGLRELGISATLINSTIAAEDQRDRMRDMVAGRFDLVYIAPERLRSPRFREAIKETRVQLLAVDEAHCVSEWGHDFRPDYMRLGEFRRRMNYPQTIALTATATARVRQHISEALQLRTPQVFITGFARPNLSFEVRPCPGARKIDELLELLARTPGSGIIYCSTRRVCEELTERISDELSDRTVGLYHGGLELPQRRMIQDQFMADELDMIVATNAFGMGIDKPDLRFVIHYNMPGSLEAYYQEAGRAGRDGKSSRCVLMFNHSDRFVHEFFIDNAYPPRRAIQSVYDYLRGFDDDPIEVTQQQLKEILDLTISAEGVGACEQVLERHGGIERLTTRENLASVRIDSDLPTLVDLLPREKRRRRKVLQAIEQLVGDRRFERVFFSLDRLAGRLELTRERLARALRELSSLEAFDYVTPFRGRAIHVPRRERRMADLDIDFDLLESRKKAEIEKLNEVVRFAGTADCRQSRFLKYFGDESAASCGHCDNCERGSTPTAPTSGPLADTIRMVLSGVARTRGRVGKLMVARMLCGSQSNEIRRRKLDQLSTFGLLGHLRQAETVELLEALVSGGLVEQKENQRFRPVVCLSDAGADVMRGTAAVNASVSISPGLQEKIERHERAVRKPSAAKRLDNAKRQDHTADPRDSAVNHQRVHEAHGQRISRESPPAENDPDPPACYWTWRLITIGFSLDQCAIVRNLDLVTICQHLVDAKRAGWECPTASLFDGTRRSSLESEVAALNDEQIQQVSRGPSRSIPHALLRLYLAVRSD